MSAILKFPTQQNARDLMVAREQAAKLPASDDIFFPVSAVPLTELTGKPDVGLQAIVREDTNEIIATHGKRYTLIKNEAIYDRVDRAIRESTDIDTNGMQITDSVAYAGGRSIRSYIFPEHKIQIGKSDHDVTNLRLNVVNSYDGSTNLRLMMGGYRMVCANGMIVGDTAAQYVARHTSGFSLGEIQTRIAAQLRAFNEAGEMWKVWANKPCDDTHAYYLLTEFANGSKKLAETLIGLWHIENRTLGKTMWALFNALTYWSTHTEVKAASQGNKPAIILEREARVTRFMSNPKLLAA